MAGRYAVDREIGRGGCATVFRATEQRSGRVVAIKVLDPQLARILGPERFRREIRILERLTHPNILPLLDAGESDGLLYYVMPLVEGQSLRHRLQVERQLPLEEALRITRGVLDALEYAHRENVVHRDIKPENILLQQGLPLVADFGIARAIVRAAGDTLSSTGFAVGTPAYMSPEQAAADSNVDGRSDLYSTACVLYEMLGGGPPFTGATPQAIQARHLMELPPPLKVVRPTLPDPLVQAIEKALAKVPADRYGSAAEFARALEEGRSGTITARTRAKGPWRWRWAAGMLGVVVAVAAGVGGVVVWREGRGVAVDPEKYVVVPFQHRGSAGQSPLSEVDCAQLILDGLRWFTGLKVANSWVVEESIRRRGVPKFPSDGMLIARDVGAGLLVWGTLIELGDSVRVEVSLFRVGNRVEDPVRDTVISLPLRGQIADGVPTSNLVRNFAELVQELILPGLAQAEERGPIMSSQSYPAIRAVLAGDAALQAWDFAAAGQHYRKAVELDPAFPQPKLRLARLGSWSGEPSDAWRPYAEAAAAAAAQLNPDARQEAEALNALAAGDFPAACAAYRALIGRDSTSFVGWYGLGECLTGDHAVVKDSISRSGYSFRTSYAAGIAAYQRALTIVPLAHLAYAGLALDRLSRKLITEWNHFRFGVAPGDPTWRYAAFPGLYGDTLGFLPYPIDEALKGSKTPPTQGRAVQRNRETLLRITTEWLKRYPASPPAMRAQARALELAGQVTIGEGGGPSALDLVRTLRARAQGMDRDLSLATQEVRLLLKAGRFTEARQKADSALMIVPDNQDAGLAQAGLAALTGRVNRAASLLERFGGSEFVGSDGGAYVVPGPAAAPARRLLAYAAAGGPADSLKALEAEVRGKTARTVEAKERPAVTDALLFRARLLGFPALGPAGGELSSSAPIEAALWRGDTAEARRLSDALTADRRDDLSGEATPDHLLLEARLLLLLGDSVEARSRLESLVDGIGSLGQSIPGEVPETVSLVRALSMYRSLTRNSRTDWIDTAAATLWRDADPNLRGSLLPLNHPQ